MSTTIGSLTFATPFFVASGTFGYGIELAPVLDLRYLGALVTKTITLTPYSGNPPPRLAELPSGLLNSIGLQNEGVEDFLKNKLPYLKNLGVPLIVSIGGKSEEDFEALALCLDARDEIAALELNISCPNIKYPARQGYHFAQDPEMTESVVSKARARTRKPLWVKLSPNVTDMGEIAKAAERGGADALVIANTYFGIKVNIETGKAALGFTVGGVSGPAIRALTLYHLYRVRQSVSLPLIGVGGIEKFEDALEYFMLGARAVQLGTVNFVDPRAAEKIVKNFTSWAEQKKLQGFEEIVGTFQEACARQHE